MAEPTLLEVEAARAMSGRPAWRVVAACINGGPCPRCGRPAGVRCIPQGFNVCPERIWAQRARERGAAKPKREHAAGAQAFIEAVALHRINADAHVSRTRDGGWCWPSAWDCAPIDTLAMDAAIACGYVRLANCGGPVWVVTDAAVVLADAMRSESAAVEQSAVHPSAPVIDAAAAVADFAARIGEG